MDSPGCIIRYQSNHVVEFSLCFLAGYIFSLVKYMAIWNSDVRVRYSTDL